MQSDYNFTYNDRKNYEKWLSETKDLIFYRLYDYRRSFLKRKNVNGYKKTNKSTPVIIDKMINAFDRKIKGLPIFTDEVKKEYFKGLNEIHSYYYDELFEPKRNRRYAYNNYVAECYCLYGHRFKHKTFKEFLNSGMYKKYR